MGRIFAFSISIIFIFQTEKGVDLRGYEALECGGNVSLTFSYDGAESMVIFEQWIQLNETLPDHCKPCRPMLDVIKDSFLFQILIAVCLLVIVCSTLFVIIRTYLIVQNLRLKYQ